MRVWRDDFRGEDARGTDVGGFWVVGWDGPLCLSESWVALVLLNKVHTPAAAAVCTASFICFPPFVPQFSSVDRLLGHSVNRTRINPSNCELDAQGYSENADSLTGSRKRGPRSMFSAATLVTRAKALARSFCSPPSPAAWKSLTC